MRIQRKNPEKSFNIFYMCLGMCDGVNNPEKKEKEEEKKQTHTHTI